MAQRIHKPLKRSRNTDQAAIGSGLPRRESWKLRSTSPESSDPGSIMLAVIARAYISKAFPAEAARPSRCAIADQRSAETTLLRIATPTAAANSHGSTPASERARDRGSTYQMTRARSAAPATTRSALFTAWAAVDSAHAARTAAVLAARDRVGAATSR